MAPQLKQTPVQQIKKELDKAEDTREQVEHLARTGDKKNTVLFIILTVATLLIFALAIVERSRPMAAVGGLGFLILIIYGAGKYLYGNKT